MAIKADFAQGFVHDHWYAAAWSGEVGSAPFPRRILDQAIVLFRAPDGTVGALDDRCPHRLAPLSLGECADGGLRCGYHGMVFDTRGACVAVPGQDTMPPGAHVRAWPVVERYGLVWIWTGSSAPDHRRLPLIAGHGEPGWAAIDGGYQHHRGNYRIEIENLMDPAHTTFLHKETIGNRAAADIPVQVTRTDRGLSAWRWIENVPPTPLDRQSHDFGSSRVDRRISFDFALPATSFVDVAVVPAGTERTEANLMQAGIRTFSYKFLTPETAHSTHFFWLHLRNYRIDDEGLTRHLHASLEKTFLEDRVMIEAIQRAQEATGLRQLTALAIDRAPIMALRLIDRMIAAETGRPQKIRPG